MHLSFSLDAYRGGADLLFWWRWSGLQSSDPARGPARSVYSGQDALRRGQDALKSALIASKMPILTPSTSKMRFGADFEPIFDPKIDLKVVPKMKLAIL